MMKKVILTLLALFTLQLQAGDPLRVLRDKGFYKTGAAAKNTSFVEWLKKPLFGDETTEASATEVNGSQKVKSASNGDSGTLFGLFDSHPVKRNAALELIRDEGYKEKEAKMRAEWEARRRASEENRSDTAE